MKEEMLVDGQDEPITSMPMVHDAAHAPGLYDVNENTCDDGHAFVGVDGNGISNGTVDATVTTTNNITSSAASSSSTLSNDVDGDHNDDNGDPNNEFVVPELTDVRKIEKIKIGYAKIARKVDVKRLKRDLWTELERTFALKAAAAAQHNTNSNDDDNNGKEKEDVETNLSTASTVSDPDLDLVDTAGSGDDDKDVDTEGVLDNVAAAVTTTNTASPSFQGIVRDMQQNQSQSDVTLPYYFICILHLCNEKELALESTGLDDFMIHRSLEDMQQQQQQHDDDELSCAPRRPRR